MNDKIKAWEGRLSQKIPRLAMGAGCGNSLSSVLVNLTVNGDTPKEPHDILRISFHPHVLDLTGWKLGDKLDVEINGNAAIVFRDNSGRQLCRTGGTAKKNGNRIYLRFALRGGSLSGFPVGSAREVESAPGRIAFLLPLESDSQEASAFKTIRKEETITEEK